MLEVLKMVSLVGREDIAEARPRRRRAEPLDTLQAAIYKKALEATGGNKSQAARNLDINYNTFLYRIRKLGIETEKS